MALLHLVYRDKLFPRGEYRRAFEALTARLTKRQACKVTVELLALAHERNCEVALAEDLAALLDAGDLPDLAVLRRRFSPDPASLPVVTVRATSLYSYDDLLGAGTGTGAFA